MRKNQTQLSTFLMFCMLIIVSSINNKISESKKELDFSSNRTDRKNEERLTNDKKVFLRVLTNKEVEKSHHGKELVSDLASKQDQSDMKIQLFKGVSSSNSSVFPENPKNSLNNSTDSNPIKNMNENPSIFSFFPYSLSMNLLGISSENSTNSNFQADEASLSKSDRKYLSMFIYLVFGTSYLLIVLILSSCKNSKNEQRKYLMKGVKIITNHNFLYFIMLTILIALSAFGLFDSVKINWSYLIASIGMSGISWVFFSLVILSFCLMIAKKWDELEVNSRNSFDFLKTNINYKSDNKGIFEIYEYLILKYFFCIPQYQVFKESNLRKEINFAYYLKCCLMQNFRLFTKLSWTCWVTFIFLMYIWSVYVSNLSVQTILIVMLTVPLLGVIVAVWAYFYMKKVFRRIIEEVDSFRVTTKWTDIEAFKPNIYKSLPLPNYLAKTQDEALGSFSFHEHFQGRVPSFYEDQIIFGSTGFFLILNILQTIGYIFTAWCNLLFMNHYDAIYKTYGYLCLCFLIPAMLVYLGVFSYVLSICLRWYTLIASVNILFNYPKIEMKRNNKAIRKLVEYHTKKAGELSNEIFKNFKRIYYEIAIKGNKDSLGQDYARKMIKTQLNRFLKNSGNENCFISIDAQLKSFLNTTGNKLNQSELQYLLYFVDDVDSLENDKITKEQFCDLYHALMKFSEEKPESILNDVLDHYFMNEKLDPSEMDVDKVRHFFDTFNEFFTHEQINYMLIECSYLEKKFSRDAFNFVVLAPRKFYPY